MINYISKAEMIDKFSSNYFGIVQFFVDARTEPEVYVRNDLPPLATKFIEAHELQHVKDGVGGGELPAFIAGIKATPLGALQAVFLSLAPSRLKMYPALSSGIALVAGVAVLIYFN